MRSSEPNQLRGGRFENKRGATARSSLSSAATPPSAVALPYADLDRSFETKDLAYKLPTVHKRSVHTSRIYKALLVLAIAVALISLLPNQGDNQSSPATDSRTSSEPVIEQSSINNNITNETDSTDVNDPGSPDAPPPDVLIQRD